MSSINRPTVGQAGGSTSTGRTVTPGWVTVRSKDGRFVLTGMLAEDPTSSGGRGGWETHQRPRKPGFVSWSGTDVATARVSVLLDAWAYQGSVESSLRVVDGMAPINPTVEPQPVYVAGAPAVPSTVAWQIQEVTLTDRLRRDSDGLTSRVTVTLDLVEYRPGDVVVVRSDPAKRSTTRNRSGTTPARSKAKTYTVRRGDTLGAIAAKYLGSASKWKTLATLNKIRNPNGLKVGQILKLQ